MPNNIKLYGGRLPEDPPPDPPPPEDPFADSMAEEMEKALNDVRVEAGMEPLPVGDRDRRMLFLAIARGVVNHLEKKQQAFQIDLGEGGHSHILNGGEHSHSGHVTIQVKEP